MVLHAVDVLRDRQAGLLAPIAGKDLGLALRFVLQEVVERNRFFAVVALDKEVLFSHVLFGIKVSDGMSEEVHSAFSTAGLVH